MSLVFSVLLLLALKYHVNAATITSTGGLTQYNKDGIVKCSQDGTGGKWSWKLKDKILAEDNHKQTAYNKTSTLTIKSPIQTEEYTCILNYQGTDENTTTTLVVANIAVESNTNCRENCSLSCVLSDLDADIKPNDTYWEFYADGTWNEVNNNVFKHNNTTFHHISSEFRYTSQRTMLNITNYNKQTNFKCVFEFYDFHVLVEDVKLSANAIALIRPIDQCDMGYCVTDETCRSFNIAIGNDTCLEECKKCYNYKYVEGDFLEKGQCMKDEKFCKSYLNSSTKCVDIETDKIARYCDLCGFCLKLEFRPESVIIPVLILIALILLIILMCYKNYDERRSILPKVHITNTDKGKIKKFGFTRTGAETVISNCNNNSQPKSSHHLAPSSALELIRQDGGGGSGVQHRLGEEEEDEGRLEGGANTAEYAVEKCIQFGSDDTLDYAPCHVFDVSNNNNNNSDYEGTDNIANSSSSTSNINSCSNQIVEVTEIPRDSASHVSTGDVNVSEITYT